MKRRAVTAIAALLTAVTARAGEPTAQAPVAMGAASVAAIGERSARIYVRDNGERAVATFGVRQRSGGEVELAPGESLRPATALATAGPLTHLLLSRSELVLVGIYGGHTLCVWDAPTHRTLEARCARLPVAEGIEGAPSLTEYALSSDGRYLGVRATQDLGRADYEATQYAQALDIVDLAHPDAPCASSGQIPNVQAVFTPEGRWLIAGKPKLWRRGEFVDDENVRRQRQREERLAALDPRYFVRTFADRDDLILEKRSDADVVRVVASRSGATLAVANRAGDLETWRLGSAGPLERIGAQSNPTPGHLWQEMAFTVSGDALLAAQTGGETRGGNSALYEWRFGAGQGLAQQAVVPEHVVGLAPSWREGRALIVDSNGALYEWAREGDRQITLINGADIKIHRMGTLATGPLGGAIVAIGSSWAGGIRRDFDTVAVWPAGQP